MENNAPRLRVNRKAPIMTYGLMAFTVAVFLVEELLGWMVPKLSGGSENAALLVLLGAKYAPLIQAGQYYRLLTPAFLHIGIGHIVLNMVSLYLWGPTLETLFGRTRFLLIYLFSAVMGNAFSYYASPAIAAGASTSIFGLFGALLAFRKQYPEIFRRAFGARVFLIIGINIVNGFLRSGVDNAGHIGGLLGGLLTGMALGTYRQRLFSPRGVLAAVGYGVLLALCLILTPLYL